MGCARPNVPNKDPKNLRDVAEPLRSILWTAQLRAKWVGLILYLVSGGRSDGQQWDLRHERCPGRECDPSCKGVPTTALPFRSNHRNLGWVAGKLIAAADMGGALSWLHANAENLGIHFPVAGEAWHAEVSGRKPKWEIIPYGQYSATPVKRTWRGFGPGATDASIAAAGGDTNEVTEVQLLLMHLGYLPVEKPDGIYGPKTQGAMTRFKAKTIRDQKFQHKPVWPGDDPFTGDKTVKMLRDVAKRKK